MFWFWGTKPIPALTLSWVVKPDISSPSNNILPSRMFNIPKIAFMAVDLPAPFGPTITAISPLSTEILQA